MGTATTKRGAFRFEITEWVSFYVDVDAANEILAMEKARNFYRTCRALSSEYTGDGAHAVLDDHSYRCMRKVPRSQGWDNTKPAARDGHHDAVPAAQ